MHAPVFVCLPQKREDLEKKQEAEPVMGFEFMGLIMCAKGGRIVMNHER